MMKRIVAFALVVLVAMLSYAHAEDAPAVENNAPAVEKDAPAVEKKDAPAQAPIAEQVPPGVTITGEREPVPMNKEQFEQYVSGGGGFIPTSGIVYRWRYTYPYAGGFRYGWRYPIRYWNYYGRSIYGYGCGFGRVYGDWYYC